MSKKWVYLQFLSHCTPFSLNVRAGNARIVPWELPRSSFESESRYLGELVAYLVRKSRVNGKIVKFVTKFAKIVMASL